MAQNSRFWSFNLIFRVFPQFSSLKMRYNYTTFGIVITHKCFFGQRIQFNLVFFRDFRGVKFANFRPFLVK